QGRYERIGGTGTGRMFKIVDEATGEPAGSVGYWEKDWRDTTVYETGWLVLPEFQGRGMAGEATQQAIDSARDERKHRYLHAFAGGGFVAVQPTHSPSAGFAPVHFEPAADWRVRTGSVHACPGVKATRCSQVSSVVSTIPSRDCLTCLPHKTVAAMAPGDILIQVQLAVEHPTYARRAFAWPPRIRRNQVPAGFEGLP